MGSTQIKKTYYDNVMLALFVPESIRPGFAKDIFGEQIYEFAMLNLKKYIMTMSCWHSSCLRAFDLASPRAFLVSRSGKMALFVPGKSYHANKTMKGWCNT